MKKLLAVVMIFTLGFSGVFAGVVNAKSGGGGGFSSSRSSSFSSSSRSSSSSFGNSSSSRPSSSGFSNSSSAKPSPTVSKPAGFSNSASKPTVAAAPPSSGFSNSGQVKATQVASVAPQAPSVKMTPMQQKMNQAYSKQESTKAFASYKTEQTKFKATEVAAQTPKAEQTRVVNNIRVKNYSSGNYYARRNVFYDTYHYRTPAYAYYSSPSFGMWDGMFLWFMLDHINDRQYANMYYNQQNNEDMKAWRREADRLARDNAELRAKLNNLDAETGKLKAQGAVIDPSYVPPDAQDMALSAKVVEENASKIAAVNTKKEPLVWPWVLGLCAALGGFFVWRKFA